MLWVFGVSSDIDASQGDLTVLRVTKPVSIYPQTHDSHQDDWLIEAVEIGHFVDRDS